MKSKLVYVELKSGYSDNGPAWIGRCKYSRTERTIYFNDRALRPTGGAGDRGNYHDVESGDEYWVSGVKKDQNDRHWAGSGVVLVDEAVVEEYLAYVGVDRLDDRKYRITRLAIGDVRSRLNAWANKRR